MTVISLMARAQMAMVTRRRSGSGRRIIPNDVDNGGGGGRDNGSERGVHEGGGKAPRHRPNPGHESLARLASFAGSECRIITQNVDGLHSATSHVWNARDRLIEAHGRLGLYKCIPETDSETDSEDDDDEGWRVQLGHRRNHGAAGRVKTCDQIGAN